MNTIEIKKSLELTDTEEARCVMHSFYNVVSVVFTEIQYLQKIFGQPELFEKSLGVCEELIASFSNRNAALASAQHLEDYEGIIHGELADAFAAVTLPEEKAAMAAESRENLTRILAVIEIRVREILARQEAPTAWVEHEIQDLRINLWQVMDAISFNARGRYRILPADAERGPLDYGLALTLRSPDDTTLVIPPVLNDVLRDLTANARKYSDPGSRIEATLEDDGTALSLRVIDQGRGIPADEIEDVVQFGVRGSNTRPEETRGGGFGLTKAYFVTKQFGGRMWIASEPGVGTDITIRIPRP